MTTPRPPRAAEIMVGLTAPSHQRDAQLGDLQEEYEERADRDAASARRWYWRQAMGSATANVAFRLREARGPTNSGREGGRMGTFLLNVRLALRSARRRPAFSAIVIGTLALGIGATTTVFSVVYGLVLHPFPFPEPERIVGVGTAYPRLGSDLSFRENLSPAEYLDVRDGSGTLEDVVAWDMGNRQIAGEGPPQNVLTAFWWGDALRTLSMEAHLGRGFTDEEVASGDAVALLAYGIWRDRFGADSSMVGRSIVVNETPHLLVGVLPEGVEIYGTDLWVVMPTDPELYPRNRRQFQLLGRVRADVTIQEVNAELEGLARRTEGAHAAVFEEYTGWHMQAARWDAVASRAYRSGAFTLLGAVGFVLLLVCANTASLMLARAHGRRRDTAVRTALGAGRGRLVSQLLIESLVLASLGGALGVALGFLGTAGVRAMLSTLSLPVAGSVELDGPVLAFTGALTLATGLIFGVMPALQGSRSDISAVMKADAKGSTTGASRQRLQRTLVAVEVALAFVLLVGGGLLTHSFVRLNQVDPGFDAAYLLSMRLTLPQERYQGDAVTAFFQELTTRVGGIPGVRAAAATNQFPPNGFNTSEIIFEGGAQTDDATLPTALATLVTRGFFPTMGIPLVAGRFFDARDGADGPLVAVLNQVAADRFYPDGSAVGRRLKLGGADAPGPWFEIVGVVESTQNDGLERDPRPEVFGLHEQVGQQQNQLFLLVRTGAEPRSLLPAIREAITAMDPNQPVYAIQTVEDAFRTAGSARRATTTLLTIFAVAALLLAAVGVYGVVSYSVGERTQEIGVRVALGADSMDVRALVVRQALLPVLLGAAAGAALSIPLGSLLRGMLFEVSPLDPLTLGAVAVLLIGVAAIASYAPAWRASRIDPVEALRRE